MRGFVGYKDKRAFMKRAPGAIAGRFFLDFPYEAQNQHSYVLGP